MFSNHKLVEILHSFLIKPINIQSVGFNPQFSTDPKNFCEFFNVDIHDYKANGQCLWWHEEPLDQQNLDDIIWHLPSSPNLSYFPVVSTTPSMCDWYQDVNFHLLANSEKGSYKSKLLKQYKFYDWYFFYHGLAALDWFRDYQYLEFTQKPTKIFMSLNHLLCKKRSYRLTLLSYLMEHQLHSFGYISAPNLSQELIRKELFDSSSSLSTYNKKHIFQNLLPFANNKILDAQDDYNLASASIIDTKFSLGALWHVVTETIFYEERLHLTEKIFKPIVMKRPFILVGAVGNLEYIKSYGFQTFDRWIDESYDNEPDPDIRLKKILQEIKKLCEMPTYRITEMLNEMQSILDYNFDHFYHEFKIIVLNELIDNFEKAVNLHNCNHSERFRLPTQTLDFVNIKKRLFN